jgi:hypothetical protein
MSHFTKSLAQPVSMLAATMEDDAADPLSLRARIGVSE